MSYTAFFKWGLEYKPVMVFFCFVCFVDKLQTFAHNCTVLIWRNVWSGIHCVEPVFAILIRTRELFSSDWFAHPQIIQAIIISFNKDWKCTQTAFYILGLRFCFGSEIFSSFVKWKRNIVVGFLNQKPTALNRQV